MDEGVVEMTGLPLEQARLANQRNYSEPVQWLGSPRWSRHHDRMGGRIHFAVDVRPILVPGF